MKRNSWVFMAYKAKEDYPNTPYFYKIFYKYSELKTFSGKHSMQEKVIYPNYCSNYFKFEKDEKNK